MAAGDPGAGSLDSDQQHRSPTPTRTEAVPTAQGLRVPIIASGQVRPHGCTRGGCLKGLAGVSWGLRALLPMGVRPGLNVLVSDYWTPAHQAVEHEDAEALARWLAAGGDPDEVFGEMTLLTHAIDVEGDGALQTGEPLTVHTTAVLLAFGADPCVADPAGCTPMGMATRYGHALAVQLLQAHISRRDADS